jgi:hypothetical protein
MQVRFVRLAALLIILLMAASAIAQEGHPLVGTWYGDWGSSPTKRNDLTLIMAWDGKAVTGTINPGPDSFPIKVATLDSTKWAFHMEGDAKDTAGMPVHFIADGKLENIGSYNRTITGTWMVGNMKADFKLKRD